MSETTPPQDSPRCDDCTGARRYHCDNLFLEQAEITASVSQAGDEMVYRGAIQEGLELKDKTIVVGNFMIASRLEGIGCTLTADAITARFGALVSEVAVQFDIAE